MTVLDEELPDVEVRLATADEADAELDPAAPEDEPLIAEEPELGLPVMVVPGRVVVGPGT